MNTVDYDKQHTVRLPSAFDRHFSGTGVAQGTDIGTPGTQAAHEAWKNAEKVRSGGGHSYIVTGSSVALDEIRYIAQTYIGMCTPGMEYSREALYAARIWVTRITNALHDWAA